MGNCLSTINDCFRKKEKENDDDAESIGQAVKPKVQSNTKNSSSKPKSQKEHNKKKPNLAINQTLNHFNSNNQLYLYKQVPMSKKISQDNKIYQQNNKNPNNKKATNLDKQKKYHYTQYCGTDQNLQLFTYDHNQEKVQEIKPNKQIMRDQQFLSINNIFQIEQNSNRSINLQQPKPINIFTYHQKQESLHKQQEHKQKQQQKSQDKIKAQQIMVSQSSEQQIQKHPLKQEEKIQIIEAEQSMYEKPHKQVVEPLLTQLRKIQRGTSEHIEDSEQFPYNRVGSIQMEINSPLKAKMCFKFRGSGTVIGSRYVLTACHNLYNFQMQKQYKLIAFKIKYNHYNDEPQFQRQFKIKQKFGNIEQYKMGLAEGNYTLDYAFLQLDTTQDLQQFTNFRYDFRQQQNNNEQKTIISYPYNQQDKITQFTESKGQVIFQNNHIYHQLQVANASSGAPIFKNQNAEYVLIGLHAGDANPKKQKNQQTEDEFRCRVGPKFTQKVFCEFVKFMATRDGHVDLKNKHIGYDGCKLLVQALKQQLLYLNLSNNKIGIQACNQLITSQWTNLKTLNLSNNFLSTPQCFQIFKTINLPKLNQLILEQNQLSAECCKHLIEAKFPTLEILNLGYNSIGDEGCQFLSQSTWPNLKNISLFWNNIYEKGCFYISKAKWQKLSFIDLRKFALIYMKIVLILMDASIQSEPTGLIQLKQSLIKISLVTRAANIQQRQLGAIQKDFIYGETVQQRKVPMNF